ncbi:ArdC-like ssDNA-binding domain-containing protein [Microlunatus sp. Y2014]|uniref:ArdC-like ssDNA-binding domain-containing protein n=1 Tax=Microlunatus sp. Y2014 TaxID=3418488 RepID=UPI003DA6F1FD
MTRKITTSNTADERRAQAQQLQASIVEQVEQLRESDAWQRFLTHAQAFHAYSINNLILIGSQFPTATRVAGFRKWQSLGRQVRKGERAIKIFGFAKKKITDDDTTDCDDEERVKIYYPVLSVFDISQTDPIEGADGTPVPVELAPRLAGDDPLGIVDAVAEWLNTQGWKLTRVPIPGEVNGYTTTDGSRRVAVDANLSPAQAAKTALHEAAHVILHADEDPVEYIAHRGIKETEAESVAYVVAGILGLDTAIYSVGYVAGWADADTELIKATAGRVLGAAHTLADALLEDDSQGETAAA